VLDASRLAIEAIESHRLASYTEKSQRYIRIGEDFIVPNEVLAAGLEGPFRVFMGKCFEHYRNLCRGLVAAGVQERAAYEDARYCLPLAVTGQLGMTVNARSLEYMVLSLLAHPLAECQDIGAQLLRAGLRVVPSLMRVTRPGPYHLERGKDVDNAVMRLWSTPGPGPVSTSDVTLVRFTPDGDIAVLAALAQPALGCSHAQAVAMVSALTKEGRLSLYRTATASLGPHDALPRELEHATLTYDMVMSAAAFAQFKRHRMTSLSSMPYDPGLDITVPPSLVAANLSGRLLAAASDAFAMWQALGGTRSPAATYALLNAHRRRVLVTLNLRELHHMSRLREDAAAQWDIRGLVSAMTRLAREAFPVCASTLGGKDAFLARASGNRNSE